MSSTALPERASLEYLKKLAKDRLRELRAADPSAKLSVAQLAVAREHGFRSWRALAAEVERRRMPALSAYFAACRDGDVAALRALLVQQPELARARDAQGSMGLHAAVAHPACLRLLLEHGADPDARDQGDNACALHFAAAGGYLESVRLLLDSGADVHGSGDLHQGDVIGWAVGDGGSAAREVVALLLERGARHHIFSAIALGDLALVRAIVEADPATLSRRRSRFEQGQTALHFALAAPDGLQPKPPRYDVAQLLIELGADLEARDDRGRTPLEMAMLHGDLEAMRLLRAAGAKEPEPGAPPTGARAFDAIRASMRGVTPMLCVADVGAAVDWYTALGFEVRARYPESGEIDWASLVCGKVELMVQGLVRRSGNQVALWLYTDRIDDVYQLLKSRQLAAARDALGGEAGGGAGVRFLEDLYEPFYGGRQFSVRDASGFEVVFATP
jgi:ankyrin repeat protein